MTTITLPYRSTLAQGQPERVAHILADLDAIVTGVNGQLDNANVSALAALAVSKLSISGTKDGTKFARDDGSWQPPSSGSWKPIADVILTADAAKIDLQGIPAAYKHLAMKGLVRSNRTANNSDDLKMVINGDTTAVYDSYFLNISAAGTGSAVGRQSYEDIGKQFCGFYNLLPGSAVAASLFAMFDLYLPHYSNTDKNKEYVMTGSVKRAATAGSIMLVRGSGTRRGNEAISSFTFTPFAGTMLVAGSRITLTGLA